MYAAIIELKIKSNTNVNSLQIKDLIQHYKNKFATENQHIQQNHNNAITEKSIFELENAIKNLKTNRTQGYETHFL